MNDSFTVIYCNAKYEKYKDFSQILTFPLYFFLKPSLFALIALLQLTSFIYEFQNRFFERLRWLKDSYLKNIFLIRVLIYSMSAPHLHKQKRTTLQGPQIMQTLFLSIKIRALINMGLSHVYIVHFKLHLFFLLRFSPVQYSPKLFFL